MENSIKINVKILGSLSFFKFQYYSDVERLFAKNLLYNNLFNVRFIKI